MRNYFKAASGRETLWDAVLQWHASRDQVPAEIDAQFEFNRFTRAWYAAHPNGDRVALLAAWNEYRSRPIDERGQI